MVDFATFKASVEALEAKLADYEAKEQVWAADRATLEAKVADLQAQIAGESAVVTQDELDSLDTGVETALNTPDATLPPEDAPTAPEPVTETVSEAEAVEILPVDTLPVDAAEAPADATASKSKK